MSTPFENKLANLIVNLRETASEATRLAAQVEAALLKIYEEEGTGNSSPEGATPSEPTPLPITYYTDADLILSPVSKMESRSIDGFYCNSNIIQLVNGYKVDWLMTPENIADLRDYAFIEVHANTGTTVSFTYATASNYTRMCFMKSMTPKVQNELKPGKIYVVHNAKRNGKNFWDFAAECPGENHQIIARAKKLAKLFAELKKEGKL